MDFYSQCAPFPYQKYFGVQIQHGVRLSSLFWRRNDFRNYFQGDLGDDKRKAVLIRGLETPFRDAAFITTFSGVELRFPNDFQGDFCR